MTDKEIDREVKRRLAIFDPFGEHFGGPAEHGEHTAPTGRSAFRWRMSRPVWNFGDGHRLVGYAATSFFVA